MLVECCHCHDETDQVLVQVNASRFGDNFLLTTYRCHQCWKYTYGMCDRAKWDTKNYPYLEETEPRNNRIPVVTEPFNEEDEKIEFSTLEELIKTDEDDLIKDVVNYYKIESEHDSVKDELDD